MAFFLDPSEQVAQSGADPQVDVVEGVTTQEVEEEPKIGEFLQGAWSLPVVLDSDLPAEQWGEFCVGPHPLIKINPRCLENPTFLVSSILHELIHFWDELWGLGLGEKKVRCLEQLLVESLSSNPEAWRNLIDGLSDASDEPEDRQLGFTQPPA